MLIPRLLRNLLVVVLLLAGACSPMLRAAPSPQPLPSPGSAWKISLKQSGGFAGVSLSLEISSDGHLVATDERTGRTVQQELPPETVARLLALYSSAAVDTSKVLQSACADCFIYDLQMSSGGNTLQVHADDMTLADSGVAELIRFLRDLRDRVLRSAP